MHRLDPEAYLKTPSAASGQ